MRTVKIELESWELKAPFVITGRRWTTADMLVVHIEEDGVVGRGEGLGIYYQGESAASIKIQADNIKRQLENGLSREELQFILPRGGARNAIDCALWDLELKKEKKDIFDVTGITPKTINTVNTVGIDTPFNMADKAKQLDTSFIKVKLDNESPLERINAVCNARPDADIVVDVNQGWTIEELKEYAPEFSSLGIRMIEQPLRRGEDYLLEGYDSPITLCADESCLDTTEFLNASKYYHMINIKLDKTGGLTEALKLAGLAKAKGLGLMVGNMMGTSLSMAPAFVIAQLCDFVDLDGALFLKDDRPNPMSYKSGIVTGLSTELWG